MKSLTLIIASAFFVLTSYGLSETAVPGTTTYQGKLTTPTGSALNDTLIITFSIYDAESGGNQLWTETHGSVTVQDGMFTVTLGSTNPLSSSIFSTTDLWLGVKVDSDPEMSPREPIPAVPFAMRAAVTDAVADSAITGAMIENGTVTPDKIEGTCNVDEVLIMTDSGWACGTYPY